ncbi:hypothetical protein D9M71_385470 [compost metagenome]
MLGGGQSQLIGAARLDQIVGCAGLHGIYRGVHGGVRGDYDHAHPRRLDAHPGEYVQAVVLAEAQVEEAQVEHWRCSRASACAALLAVVTQ